jgi:hypothetical protein
VVPQHESSLGHVIQAATLQFVKEFEIQDFQATVNGGMVQEQKFSKNSE